MKIGSLHFFQKSKFTPAFTGVSAGFYDVAVKLKRTTYFY
jgi:hypothetical protein